MRFIADEGVDKQIVAALRERGHDVVYIAEIAQGVSDDLVLAMTNSDERILVTRDKDFGEMVFRLKKVHTGIVLKRLHQLDSASKIRIFLEVIEKHGPELLGCYTVIQPGKIRIKKMVP